MGRAILLSILVATIAVPALTARDRSAVRGMKRMLLLLLAFNLVWMLLVVFVYAQFFKPETW